MLWPIHRKQDYEFANLMVQMLNLILLTAPELYDFRQELKYNDFDFNLDLFSRISQRYAAPRAVDCALLSSVLIGC